MHGLSMRSLQPILVVQNHAMALCLLCQAQASLVHFQHQQACVLLIRFGFAAKYIIKAVHGKRHTVTVLCCVVALHEPGDPLHKASALSSLLQQFHINHHVSQHQQAVRPAYQIDAFSFMTAAVNVPDANSISLLCCSTKATSLPEHNLSIVAADYSPSH